MDKLMINDLKESLLYGDKMFRTLRGVEPLLNEHKQPLFVAGRNSVVFRISLNQRLYALKCYTSKAEHTEEICAYLGALSSPLIVQPQFFPEELWTGSYYSDVVLYPWQEGHTFEWMIRKALYDKDVALLRSLEERLIGLIQSIYRQEWRHGDLKAENIVVRPDDSLILVDCDSLYAPSLPPRANLGTPRHIHPLRGDAYDSHIDDYAAALMVLSLEALQRNLSLYHEETMVALPEEGNTEHIAELFEDNEVLLSLLEALLSDNHKITNLNHLLECIMHT